MKKLFMKLCGYVRKLRSSQPTLQPMNVKIKLHSDVEFQSILFDFDKTKVNVKMDYYDWMQYLHDEIQKYEYKTSTKYWCSGDGSKILKEANTLMDNYTELTGMKTIASKLRGIIPTDKQMKHLK